RRVLDIERRALGALADGLDWRFARVIELLLACRGRVIVTGVGKSGIVCRKIAATLASTGTPAFFLHAGEGSHGDLGTLVRGDVLLAVSNSGESAEVLSILPARSAAASCASRSSCTGAPRCRSWPSMRRSRTRCSRSPPGGSV